MWPSTVPPHIVPTPSPLNEIKLAFQLREEEGGGPGGRGGQAPSRAAGDRRRADCGLSSGPGSATWQWHPGLLLELVSASPLLLGL